jgi:ABC-2 type transport system ATP-binding protein
MLAAQHLVKRFYGVTVVNDIGLNVGPGEIVGYVGPNGSGKTTTVRMLTGLRDPTSGQVFEGCIITADPIAFRRHLGYVPEEPHLYPFLSGREYLELVGRLRQLPAALLERKIEAIRSSADQTPRRWPSVVSTAEISASSSKGLLRCPSNPAASVRWWSPSLTKAVTATTGG